MAFVNINLPRRDEIELQALIAAFPGILQTAVTDWAKFKAGFEAGLFTDDQAQEVISWFREFPRLWRGIRPNFDPMMTMADDQPMRSSALQRQADWFVQRLSSAPLITGQLGVAPIVIAGIVIAGLFGVAGVYWGIGYIKRQSNISRLINEVVEGNLPVEVLESAISADQTSIFGEITSGVKWMVIAGGLFVLYPYVQPYLKKIMGTK